MSIEESLEILLNAAWLGTNEERNRVEEAVKLLVDEVNKNKWITDELPKEHDMYLVTWTSKTSGDYRWLALLEFFPDDEDGNEGEGWATYDIEKMGYKDIEIIAWKPVEPYDPEGGI